MDTGRDYLTPPPSRCNQRWLNFVVVFLKEHQFSLLFSIFCVSRYKLMKWDKRKFQSSGWQRTMTRMLPLINLNCCEFHVNALDWVYYRGGEGIVPERGQLLWHHSTALFQTLQSAGSGAMGSGYELNYNNILQKEWKREGEKRLSGCSQLGNTFTCLLGVSAIMVSSLSLSRTLLFHNTINLFSQYGKL